MPILNYTTRVPTAQTISEIMRILAKKGAESVTQDFGLDGEVSAVKFLLRVGRGRIHFLLPANIGGVMRCMKTNDRKKAERVAWRIVKDWVEAQIALIESGQADTAQVFMPYAQDDSGETMYKHWLDSNQKQLPERTQ